MELTNRKKRILRAIVPDCDHILKMSRIPAVYSSDRPFVIVDIYMARACIYHWFYTDDHSLDQLFALPRPAVVRYLGGFVQSCPDSVPYQFPYH